MEELEVQNRGYEFAYHLNPDIEEADVRKNVQELEDIISRNGGSVLTSREPKRKHLSYPIKHKHYSHFGCIDFSSLPEVIEKINAQMKLEHGLLRYLITEKPDEKELRVLGTERPRAKFKREAEGEKAGKEETKPEQIEKEIEDVLEKI